MKRAHDGPASLLTSVGKALKADEPDWPDIQSRTRRLVEVTAAIDRTDPPLGEKESWEKLARAYLANVKALDEAAAKKDRTAARTAKAKIDASCGVCHKAHRPPDP
jgi:mono/diheme cytochrome c family protein